MQKMGLSAAELRTYHETLRTSHTRQIEVEVLNLGGEVINRLSPEILDGQVLVDLDAEVSRVLTMQFLDPHHNLNFDSESPGDGALFADRMLRVAYTVLVPDLGHVSCVVFTGPLVKLDRSGDVVTIEAHGKERLALGEMWRPLTIKKRTKKVDAIRTIMEDRAGETRFDFPNLNTRMPKTRSLNRFASAWKHARRIARSMDRQLYYTGDGVCALRKYPTSSVFTFNTGLDGEVLSDVQISNQMDDFRNVILVVGGKPKGAKRRVRAKAIVPDGHPLSPERLGREVEGEIRPRFLVEKIEDDSFRSRAECRRKAERVLEDRVKSVVQVTFDSLPIPHLDAGDWVRIKTDVGVVGFRLRQFSLPLSTEGDATMSVGYHKRTVINRREIRRR